jgi:hypothetical protein
MNLELLYGSDDSSFSIPSQVAEAALGYDIALVPAMPSIWPLLGYPFPARGTSPGYGVLAHRSAPTFAASLFLQYKRPEELRRSTAGEVRARRAAGADPCLPYFRYGLDPSQMQVLIALSREVGDQAVVSYAAPAFTGLRLLNDLRMARSVAAESNFLPLVRLDKALQEIGEGTAISRTSRHVWTYGEPGHKGVLCSEPVAIESWNVMDLQRLAADQAVRAGYDLRRHVVALARRIGQWEEKMGIPVAGKWHPFSDPDWRRRRFLQAPPEVNAAISVQDSADRQGVGWFLALVWMDEAEPAPE